MAFNHGNLHPHEVQFSRIPETVPPRRMDQTLTEYHVKRQDFRREPKDIILNFHYSMKLIFNNQWEYHCKQITLSNVGRVELHKAHIFGSISIVQSTLVVNDCIFEKPLNGIDYFISATNKSTCMISNTNFSDTQLYGLCVDDYSEMGLNSCIILKCGLASLSVTGKSKCYCQNTTILENLTNGIIVKMNSEIYLTDCIIKNTKKKGMSVTSSFAKLKNCVFANNGSSALSFSKSIGNTMENCEITGCSSVSLKLEDSRLTILNSRIHHSKKTCIRSVLNSHLNVKKCTFSDCKWSLISIYGETHFNCAASLFEMSNIRGITASDDSHLNLIGCTFRHFSENGVRVIGTKNAFIDDCVFYNCRLSGLDVCDYGDAIVNNSIFAGGYEHGVKVFTGASCSMDNVYFFGPFHHAINLNYGGFGFFSNCIFGNLQNSLKFENIRPFAAHANMLKMIKSKSSICECFDRLDKNSKYDTRFIKVNTQWFSTVTHCFIIDVGQYELIANQNRIKNTLSIPIEKLKPAKCKICEKSAIGIHFYPCGHCVYCTECWNKSDTRHPKRCPVCRSIIEKTVSRIDTSDDDKCPICYDAQIDSIILPCGHTVCKECAMHWLKTSSICPFCREANVKVRQFVPYE